jgi:hypothetical protein
MLLVHAACFSGIVAMLAEKLAKVSGSALKVSRSYPKVLAKVSVSVSERGCKN